jgi:hypothetical protein
MAARPTDVQHVQKDVRYVPKDVPYVPKDVPYGGTARGCKS